MAYIVQPYTLYKAKKLGVFVQPSRRSNYKIDVFNKKGEYMFSGGARGYGDYPTFLKEKGEESADKHRNAYHIRHKKDMSVAYTKGWWIGNLLW